MVPFALAISLLGFAMVAFEMRQKRYVEPEAENFAEAAYIVELFQEAEFQQAA